MQVQQFSILLRLAIALLRLTIALLRSAYLVEVGRKLNIFLIFNFIEVGHCLVEVNHYFVEVGHNLDTYLLCWDKFIQLPKFKLVYNPWNPSIDRPGQTNKKKKVRVKQWLSEYNSKLKFQQKSTQVHGPYIANTMISEVNSLRKFPLGLQQVCWFRKLHPRSWPHHSEAFGYGCLLSPCL